MAAKVPKDNKLKTLNVQGNGELLAAPEGGEAMGELIAKCAHLETLGASHTGLTAQSVTAMAAKVPKDNKLKSINVGDELRAAPDGGDAMQNLRIKFLLLEVLFPGDFMTSDCDRDSRSVA